MRTLAAALLALALLSGAQAAEVGPGYDILMSRMIPVRDGVELEAWITRPSHLTAPAPAILTLTQYDIDGGRTASRPTSRSAATCGCRRTCAVAAARAG